MSLIEIDDGGRKILSSERNEMAMREWPANLYKA